MRSDFSVSTYRWQVFGVGWLLRHMSFAGGAVQLPAKVALFSAPEKAVRGHQIGYRMKNNTYDAWNLAQFEQQIRDLAGFRDKYAATDRAVCGAA